MTITLYIRIRFGQAAAIIQGFCPIKAADEKSRFGNGVKGQEKGARK